MSDRDLITDAPVVDPPAGATHQHDALSTTTSRWALYFGRLVYTHNPFYAISA